MDVYVRTDARTSAVNIHTNIARLQVDALRQNCWEYFMHTRHSQLIHWCVRARTYDDGKLSTQKLKIGSHGFEEFT